MNEKFKKSLESFLKCLKCGGPLKALSPPIGCKKILKRGVAKIVSQEYECEKCGQRYNRRSLNLSRNSP